MENLDVLTLQELIDLNKSLEAQKESIRQDQLVVNARISVLKRAQYEKDLFDSMNEHQKRVLLQAVRAGGIEALN